MRKILLIAVFAIFATNAFAYKTFCKFQYYEGVLFIKSKTCFDFGSGYKAKLCDENKNIILFKSDIDVINYMSKLGWNLEQNSILELDEKGGKCEFLMSKEVKTDDEIFQGLNVEFDK